MDFETSLKAFERAAKAKAAADGGVEFGQKRCVCGAIYQWEDEPTCSCERDRIKREQREARERCLRKSYESVPAALRWAREGSEAFGRVRIHSECQRLIKWHHGLGNGLVCGPTGAGKTVSCAALIHRILDRARDHGATTTDFDFARRIRFVDASDLARARRESKLGEEPELLIEAGRASLLVIDEMGFEPWHSERDRALFDVLNERYSHGGYTIVTTGRTAQEFKARYGAAMVRRIVDGDRGFVLDLFGAR